MLIPRSRRRIGQDPPAAPRPPLPAPPPRDQEGAAQRRDPWIKALLASLAQAGPGFLTATPTSSGQGTRFLPWMSRSDRRSWRSARTISDLGELMALWLEGKIASRPGYQPRYGPDDETAHLVPTLAALCRAGYVTTCSQPGFAGTGADGLWWEQRAAAELVVTDPALVHRLVDAAYAAGLSVRINDYRSDGGVQEPPRPVPQAPPRRAAMHPQKEPPHEPYRNT